MLMDTPPTRGGRGRGGNKQSMRNEEQRTERESERGKDEGMEGLLNVVLVSALTPSQPFPELVSAFRM